MDQPAKSVNSAPSPLWTPYREVSFDISAFVGVERRAGAHEVTVAAGAVDATHRGPVLVLVRNTRRVHRQLAVVRLVPLADQRLRGVRGATQRAFLGTPTTIRDLVDLGADRDHRVAEPVDLAEVLALGRLDHEGARDRERHRRCVEAVVD